MKSIRLEEVCEINIGRTPARAEPTFWGTGHHWLSIADMNQGLSITHTKEQITAEGARAGKIVRPGTVLLSFKLSIGKVGIASIPLYTNEAIAALPIKDPNKLDSRYLMRALQAMNLADGSNRAAMGAVLNKRTLASIRIPLPPLPEQRRIAAILDHADSLRTKRRQVLTHLDSLIQSIFHDMFGGSSRQTVRLEDVAIVSSGITKGRKTSEATNLTPYLAVANVQAGHLKMDAVKEIPATVAEIQRYALQDGDLVLTEGGDPDKLGRGTVWRSQLPLCLHQNHIFRVRPDVRLVLPDYLAASLASPELKSYFLRSAKQTTGIASINMTQLRAAPVPIPSMSQQLQFLTLSAAIESQRLAVQHLLSADDELFASLQSRAFRGEL
ncbi:MULTISPECIES: restriction endonuclease subunit S [Gordonia]|uniref:restriction endonuclease subunit S n=1 Tax=Gordonia TaxID=2053 RepID=UPI001BCD729F|nr:MULTISPECIES: restriction endonuclease subunit S [Gordonia]